MTFLELLKKHGLEDQGDRVGPGWVPLLDRLITKLTKLGWDRQVEQIKEKFGGLRFYINGATPEINEAIDEAENESYRTCEDCGEPGRERVGGWIRTLCAKCYRSLKR